MLPEGNPCEPYSPSMGDHPLPPSLSVKLVGMLKPMLEGQGARTCLGMGSDDAFTDRLGAGVHKYTNTSTHASTYTQLQPPQEVHQDGGPHLGSNHKTRWGAPI